MAGFKNITNTQSSEIFPDHFSSLTDQTSWHTSSSLAYMRNENLTSDQYSELLYRPPNPTPPVRYNYEEPQYLKN